MASAAGPRPSCGISTLAVGSASVTCGTLVDDIIAKVLTQRLRQLERDGLVSRTVHEEISRRVEYEITYLGRGLARLLVPRRLVRWTPGRGRSGQEGL